MADDRTPPTRRRRAAAAGEQPPAEEPGAARSPPRSSPPRRSPPRAGAAEQPAAEQPAAEEPAAEPAGRRGRQRRPPRSPPDGRRRGRGRGRRGRRRRQRGRRRRRGDAPAPREKPAIPGADLEVDIVTDRDRLGTQYDEDVDPDAEPGAAGGDEADVPDDQPIAAVEINLSADARYRATGKRKTAVARVTLRPGTGAYTINGKPLDDFFPRPTLQRTIRQPLETVGYEDRMDVVARMHGGGVSAQAGALRHGISRALLEADPNLLTELKRRGFLTRDSRVKERKKAGLKKARKRPQFSKR